MYDSLVLILQMLVLQPVILQISAFLYIVNILNKDYAIKGEFDDSGYSWRNVSCIVLDSWHTVI